MCLTIMIILGIESTCDETSAAVVQDGRSILSLSIASSSDIHESFGGVFPELACRRHVDVILPIIDDCMKKAVVTPQDIDAIAVARGPGLIGALLIGLQAAKGLAISWNKPLIGINHVEAHLYAAMMTQQPLFPALGFVLSGGHTLMLKVSDVGGYELLGTTVDDAIGEAFDKAASMLGLAYPGGPKLEKLAESGDATKFSFSPSRVKKNPLAFSFSGLKTAVLYAKKTAAPSDDAHIAASFQKTAFDDLSNKARLAWETDCFQSMIFGGGVSNNRRLRAHFSEQFPNIPLFWPPAELTSDNAAMIAGLAHHKYLLGQRDDLDLEALPRMPFWVELKVPKR
ncbi:MAG: tRNA N6-adenosine threonylcarbamoyltransferase [Parachlamydiales bacterium]|nr:tRNA N6-adenosine threonylcarbamoyltransferase [Parachlamydiales bacterium]